VYGKERKKKYMCMREWKRVIEKEKKKREKKKKERGVARKIWEGWMKWKEKNKVQERTSRCWETNLSLFFQPCAIRQRGHHWCLVVKISFALAHVHHSISSYPWYPYIWFSSHGHWLWKVNNH
jgi:hypothetical protein